MKNIKYDELTYIQKLLDSKDIKIRELQQDIEAQRQVIKVLDNIVNEYKKKIETLVNKQNKNFDLWQKVNTMV